MKQWSEKERLERLLATAESAADAAAEQVLKLDEALLRSRAENQSLLLRVAELERERQAAEELAKQQARSGRRSQIHPRSLARRVLSLFVRP